MFTLFLPISFVYCVLHRILYQILIRKHRVFKQYKTRVSPLFQFKDKQEIDTLTLIEGINGKIEAIECGMMASFALNDEGIVYSWGTNTVSILGLKKKMNKKHVIYDPTQIDYFVKNEIKINDLCCGAKHMIVMDINNNCYCWGSNKLGQCGIGKLNPEYVDIPRKIKVNKDLKVREWRVGSYHTFIKSINNEWYAFGSNAFRQCIIRGDEFDERVITPTLIDDTFLPKKCHVNKMDIVCGRETTLILF